MSTTAERGTDTAAPGGVPESHVHVGTTVAANPGPVWDITEIAHDHETYSAGRIPIRLSGVR